MKNKKVVCHNRYGEKHEVDSSELFFRPSVYGVLVEGDKVLLSKQWDGYDFPGGGIYIHETIDEALEREFWEETGLKVKRGNIVACESNFFTSDLSKKSANFILTYFLVNKIDGEISIDNIDTEESRYIDMPEWIDLKDIDKIKFYNNVDSPKLIREAIKINKNYENINFRREG